MIKGSTIRFVIMRVGYIRDLIYRRNLYGVQQNTRDQTFFVIQGN